MALNNIFATSAGGSQVPLVELDQNFNAVGAMGITQCTATGTNAIVLTPVGNQPTVSNPPQNLQQFSFFAAATSTGPVTIQQSGGTAIPLQVQGAPAVQVGSGGIVINVPYTVMFVQAYNGGTGGYIVTGNGSPVPRGQLGGLTLSNDGTSPNTTIDISAGQCADSTNTVLINLGAFTKILANPFSAGSGNNGCTITAPVASTWYHVFAAIINGAADVFFDTSVSAANAPAGTTAFRRIGSILTDGSGHIIAFTQHGDIFAWHTPPALDLNAAIGAGSGTLVTLSVPIDIIVQAIMELQGDANSSGNLQVILTDPANADVATSPNASPLATLFINAAINTRIGVPAQCWTNTSAQIRARASNGVDTVRIQTYGWVDTRGRFA